MSLCGALQLNSLEGVDISIIGDIEELSQQEYRGKRVFIRISDQNGYELNSKIDLGVHANHDIEQDNYCFDVCMDDEGAAVIDQDKCIVCGACVYECPFGAVNDISGIMKVVDAIKNKGPEEKIFAVVAPAVAVQFPGTTVGQVFSAIKALGFDGVYEVAMGADETAITEAKELKEKGFLTSSCCPAFVEYVNIEFPDLKDHVSTTLSPMALTGRAIKKQYPDSRIYFIGPCIAKKYECKTDRAEPYIDRVLTFLELMALLDSKDIEIESMEPMDVQDASPYGRGFAKSGGVTNAIVQAVTNYNDAKLIAELSSGLGEAMVGTNESEIKLIMEERGK